MYLPVGVGLAPGWRLSIVEGAMLRGGGVAAGRVPWSRIPLVINVTLHKGNRYTGVALEHFARLVF